MKIQIEGRHLKVTPPIQEYVQKKIGRLDKYFDGIMNVRVVLGVRGAMQQVDIFCSVARGQPLVAAAEREDMYIAVDEAVRKVRDHLKKHKERLRGRKRTSARLTQPTASPDPEEQEEEEE